MTSELKQRLEQMADRGERRGADSVMLAARTDAERPLAVPSPTAGPRYGWLVALGAAALVLIMIGGVAWWAALTQGDDMIADEPQPTTTVPEVTSTIAAVVPAPTTVPDAAPTTIAETAPTAPLPSPLRWMPIDDEAVFANTAMFAIVPRGAGLIAVGEADEEAPYDEVRGDIAVWLSADGTTWERIHDSSFNGDPDSACISTPLYQGVGGVAVGPLGMIITGTDSCHGAVWISEDGRTWTEAIADEWRANPIALGSVVAGGPGWVIAGSDGHGNGAVWVSSDGVEWTASDDEDLIAEEGNRLDTAGVAGLGEDLILLGFEGGYDSTHTSRETQPVVWISPDGAEWERLPAETIAHDDLLIGLATVDGGGRLVAYAPPTQTVQDWTLWTSTDGTAWTSLTLPDYWGDAVIWEGDTIVTSTGFVSTDSGATWIDVGEGFPGPAYATPTVVSLDGRIFVGGYERGVMARAGWGESGGSTSTVWIGEWIEEEGS